MLNLLVMSLTPTAMVLVGILKTKIDLGVAGASMQVAAAVLQAAPTIIGSAVGALSLCLMVGTRVRHAAAIGTLVGCVWLATMIPEAIVFTRELSWAEPDRLFAPAVSLASLLLVGGASIRLMLPGGLAQMRSPKRVSGKRAVHGEAAWLKAEALSQLFPQSGGIVIGERSRVDLTPMADKAFRVEDRTSWGDGGLAPLLCFDCSFGSTHGLVFAGSGGFKTSSVTVPTALSWPHGLVVLDPSAEVLPMVEHYRRRLGRTVVGLAPAVDGLGFNALDWIGSSGSPEEDIVSVAGWIMPQSGRSESIRDDFFRGTAVQLLTALIADVCLSGHTPQHERTLRQVRANLAEPEPRLRERLQKIHDESVSAFVRENVAPFINMTPETFSGVYASAAKETHWLSYERYAAIVSGAGLRTDQLAEGNLDIFINIDLPTLENHPGLARVVVGSLTNAVFSRRGAVPARTLFLLDEAARLGYMKILEIARDAGRKYGITLILMFQSIGQMREAYGGRDATSKWFESASWVSFAAINDLETAEYISRRCGEITVEVDQVTRSSSGASRSRTRQLVRRPLILPHEVMGMRADEQVIFSAGSAPIRAGRALYFRRPDMCRLLSSNPFRKGS